MLGRTSRELVWPRLRMWNRSVVAVDSVAMVPRARGARLPSLLPTSPGGSHAECHCRH